MSDDLKNRGMQDRIRININEPYEVEYWMKTLGVSKEQLEAAVRNVGVMVVDVRTELAKH